MAAEHWFRWHHGTVTDPKWLVIAARASKSLSRNVTQCHVLSVWACMLECASQANPRGTLAGWCDEDVAACLGMDEVEVAAIREAMQGKTLDGDQLSAWSARQIKREDTTAAERKKAERERRKSREVTTGHAASRDVTLETETETETEKKKEQKHSPEGDLFSGVDPRVVADFKALRKAKKAPITETAIAGIKREARKAGLSLGAALAVCCERGWTGFKAEWVEGQQVRGKGASGDAFALAQ